jgi:hypothetical protein
LAPTEVRPAKPTVPLTENVRHGVVVEMPRLPPRKTADGPVLFCSMARVGLAEVLDAESQPHGVEVPAPNCPANVDTDVPGTLVPVPVRMFSMFIVLAVAAAAVSTETLVPIKTL